MYYTTGTLANTLGENQPFRYRGYVYDTDTGWYYLQSRYYDPYTCRFISADVYLSTGQGVIGNNSFAYCLNNPVNRADEGGALSKGKKDIFNPFEDGGGGYGPCGSNGASNVSTAGLMSGGGGGFSSAATVQVKIDGEMDDDRNNLHGKTQANRSNSSVEFDGNANLLSHDSGFNHKLNSNRAAVLNNGSYAYLQASGEYKGKYISKDFAGHANSAFKLFESYRGKLRLAGDLDINGKLILAKHSSNMGKVYNIVRWITLR